MEPIDWLPWSQEAFRRAEAEQKPVLLSLVTDWCGLSMLMDRSSYVDPQVQELIREGLIPVRVDADEHPDINERYNVGGWPTTAFLSPEGDLLAAATYIEPVQLRQMLVQLGTSFSSGPFTVAGREEIEETQEGHGTNEGEEKTEGAVRLQGAVSQDRLEDTEAGAEDVLREPLDKP